MPKRIDTQKIKSFASHILEPFALGVLALLFIIPAVTVVNLTPITKGLEKLNVLGVSTKDEVEFTLVEGKHEIFRSETLVKNSIGNYTYSTTLTKRVADSYSKPVIQIENKTEKAQKVTVYGQTSTSTQSRISMIVDDKTYQLQSANGQTTEQNIVIASGEKVVIFLAVENLSGVQFSEDFEMDMQVSDI